MKKNRRKYAIVLAALLLVVLIEYIPFFANIGPTVASLACWIVTGGSSML